MMIACGGSPAGPSDAKAQPGPASPPLADEHPPEHSPTGAEARARTWSFDDATPGQVPPGFRISETGAAGSPARWEVRVDPSAPTSPHVFGIAATKNTKATYNLALIPGTRYDDVDLSVMVRADTGTLDQGGGPIWRVTDEHNYYIARWNPLEKNARFYVVEGGARSALGKVELELDPEAWHSLRVVAEGARMELFINDVPVLRVSDDTHSQAGMVGLWTKADAGTWFDDLSVVRPR